MIRKNQPTTISKSSQKCKGAAENEGSEARGFSRQKKLPKGEFGPSNKI